MELKLSMDIKTLRGPLCVWLPPPPGDRMWFSFLEPPQLQVTASPLVNVPCISSLPARPPAAPSSLLFALSSLKHRHGRQLAQQLGSLCFIFLVQALLLMATEAVEVAPQEKTEAAQSLHWLSAIPVFDSGAVLLAAINTARLTYENHNRQTAAHL